MKTVIVYYSLEGNTDCAAHKLAEALDADLLRIEPRKAYPDTGAGKFFWGGKSAVMAEKPALTPYKFDADAYGRVVIGFPVWAGTFSPPIRSFVLENAQVLKGKSIAVFACQSGAGAEKAFAKLKRLMEIEGFEAEAVLIDPKDRPSDENERAISAFCAKLG